MQVFVGINVDSDIDFSKYSKYTNISVKVKSIKVLDLDTISLIDLDVKDCKDVIGFNFNSGKCEYDFTVSCSYRADRRYIYTYAKSNYINSSIAVYQNGSLLGGEDSTVLIDFNDSFSMEISLLSFALKITNTIYTLYNEISRDNDCNGYEDLLLIIDVEADIFEATKIFSKIDEFTYCLFDKTYIISELHNDVIVSSNIDTLVIYLGNIDKHCNVVIPPSVNRVIIGGKYGSDFCDDEGDFIVTFLIPESKKDEILELIADELRYPNIAHLIYMQVLDRFGLDAKYYR